MNARRARLIAMEWIVANIDYLAETYTGEIEELDDKDVDKVRDQVSLIGRQLSRRIARQTLDRPEGTE